MKIPFSAFLHSKSQENLFSFQLRRMKKFSSNTYEVRTEMDFHWKFFDSFCFLSIVTHLKREKILPLVRNERIWEWCEVRYKRRAKWMKFARKWMSLMRVIALRALSRKNQLTHWEWGRKNSWFGDTYREKKLIQARKPISHQNSSILSIDAISFTFNPSIVEWLKRLFARRSECFLKNKLLGKASREWDQGLQRLS
jgi:hypothetical protein